MKISNNLFLRWFVYHPISYLWRAIYALRRELYRAGMISSNDLGVPVISIGNLSFGGTGKTPFTIWLANFFAENSLKPSILMRGYKGNREDSHGVIRAGERFKFNPIDFGDEPVIIAKKIKSGQVIVGKKRYQNFSYYKNQIDTDIVLLDDGFQHLKIRRDFNIVLFDGSMSLKQYRVAPLGYLREGMEALKDADALVISRADQLNELQLLDLRKMISKYVLFPQTTPVAGISYHAKALIRSMDGKKLSLEDLPHRKFVALAGVASPQSFFKLVESFGILINRRFTYPDHHFFTPEEIQEILQVCEDKDLNIVCTEKDMVKLRRLTQDPRIHHIEIDVQFLFGEEELMQALKNEITLF